jgi:hypothetical protein
MNCTATSKKLGAWVFCELTVTKYGNPQFTFLTEVNFGNNFTQEIGISHLNSSFQSFVAKYKNQYEYPDDYEVNFNIPELYYSKYVVTVPIIGEIT